jgi:hypothetical protein
VVRSFEAHEWRTLRELRSRALADAPEAFARTLADEERRSDSEWAQQLHDSARSPSRLSLVAERDGARVGLAYSERSAESPDTAHLVAMWVAPEAGCAGGSTRAVRGLSIRSFSNVFDHAYGRTSWRST